MVKFAKADPDAPDFAVTLRVAGGDEHIFEFTGTEEVTIVNTGATNQRLVKYLRKNPRLVEV